MFFRRRLQLSIFALIACFSMMLTVAYAWSGVNGSGTHVACAQSCMDEAPHDTDAPPADCPLEDNTSSMDDLLESFTVALPLRASVDEARPSFVVQWRDATIARPTPPPDV